MNKTCLLCKGDMSESTTTHLVEFDSNKILIVKNVPCYKCSQCGEVVYSLKVARKLEEITIMVKNSLSEIEVVNFSMVA